MHATVNILNTMQPNIEEFDNHRDNVIIIGGGFAGITMACQLQRRFKFEDFTIIDKSPEMVFSA